MSTEQVWVSGLDGLERAYLTVDESQYGEVRLDGRRIGEVHQGANDEWYFVTRSREAEAYPLRFLDNVAGTGFKSPMEAARHYVEHGG